MGIEITAKVRCGRVQSLGIGGTPSNDQVIDEANRCDRFNWKRLDDNGFEVTDYHRCPSHVLCGACAEAYKDVVAEKAAKDAAFFGGAR